MAGKLLLRLGPSGSGKGTIITYIKQKFPNFVFPASFTTRVKRPNEINDEVYHFISQEEFQNKINNNEFLEWAIVHEDNYYGTDKKTINEGITAGKIVVREVDIQGVESIWQKMGKENVITVFITTTTWEDLKRRILGRAQMDEDDLIKRERSYIKEMEFSKKCDYIVASEFGKIDQAYKDIDTIIQKIIA